MLEKTSKYKTTFSIPDALPIQFNQKVSEFCRFEQHQLLTHLGFPPDSGQQRARGRQDVKTTGIHPQLVVDQLANESLFLSDQVGHRAFICHWDL